MRPSKLTLPLDGDLPVVWPHVYRQERTTGPDRLAVAPRQDPLEVMCVLADEIGPEYFALFVHAVARSDAAPGRYQSPPLQLVDLKLFVAEYSAVLENDARHNFWIGSTSNRGMLVLDEHGIIYAYGPLEAWKESLAKLGIREGGFSIPCPHAHNFHDEYDAEVGRLLTHWEWHHTALRPEDER